MAQSTSWKLTLRRVASFLVGLLLFLLMAPEFRYMHRTGIAFWTVLPFLPVVLVCFGVGRNRYLEAAGWFLQVVGIVIFLHDTSAA
jgi:hypothetical protein